MGGRFRFFIPLFAIFAVAMAQVHVIRKLAQEMNGLGGMVVAALVNVFQQGKQVFHRQLVFGWYREDLLFTELWPGIAPGALGEQGIKLSSEAMRDRKSTRLNSSHV